MTSRYAARTPLSTASISFVQSPAAAKFTAAGIPKENISFSRETFTFEYDEPPAALVDKFRHFYGPTMNAFDAAAKNGKADALQGELQALFESHNKSGRKDTTSIAATYLKVVVTVA